MPDTIEKKHKLLTCLWWFFLCFVAIVMGFGIFFYFQQTLVTTWALEIYSTRLSSVLTEEGHYKYLDDSQYPTELAAKKNSSNFEESAFRQNFLSQRRQEIYSLLKKLIQAYCEKPEADWLTIWRGISQDTQNILEDEKVTPQEFQELSKKISTLLTQNN